MLFMTHALRPFLRGLYGYSRRLLLTPAGCRGEPGLHEEVLKSLITVCVLERVKLQTWGLGGEMRT